MKIYIPPLLTQQVIKNKSLQLVAATFIFLMAMPVRSMATVTVTAPSLTVYACGGTFPTDYSTLGNIVLENS